MEMQQNDDGPLPKNFPMHLANNGQYAKTFQKKRHQFGSEKFGWKAALDRFNHDWPFIILGKVPPAMPVDGVDPSTLEYIATKFIEREDKRCKRHIIKGGSFIDIRNAVEIAVTHLGKLKRPAHLLPDDFADLRHAQGYDWKRENDKWIKTTDLIGPAALKRRIVHVRAMFRWAVREKLLQSLPAYGDEYPIVSDATVEKAKNNRERQHGAKRFEVSEITPIFNALDEQLQAMFLLTINCGFTAVDCAALPWSRVDLDKGWIDFARVKTGVERMRLPLWPETVEALKHVKALKLSPAPGLADLVVHQDRGDKGEAIGEPITLKDCAFITSMGRPWVTRKISDGANGLPSTESHKDSVALEFNKVLVTLKIKRVGVGFGAGRHTFETHALRVADKSLVDAVMGHSTGAMSRNYDHALDDDLLAMARGVRGRLLPDAKQWSEASATGAPAGTMRIAG